MGRKHDLIAQHKAIHVEMMPVNLPAPRHGIGRNAENADEIIPFAVLFRPARQFEQVVAEFHDVASRLVAAFAQTFAKQSQNRFALWWRHLLQTDAMTEQKRMCVTPSAPFDAIDR